MQQLTCLQVDRQAVLTKGKEVMADLLINLQVRKSTADAAGSKAFYEDLTEPIDGWTTELRQLVLFKKQASLLQRYQQYTDSSTAPKDLCPGMSSNKLVHLLLIKLSTAEHICRRK